MIPSIYHAGFMAMAALSMIGQSSAHLILKSPVPFGTDTLNNSPLVDAAIGSSGSDYPCKQRPGVYKISQMNNMKVGDSQSLSFTGSASHGGGTCQLAVSLDQEPTTNSTWKIIQVYEGGCPVTGTGNDGTDTFTYKIPDKFPNGQATLAWTWYNRIGNREIYMNCAPITVSGGADNNDYYNTLPDMYIINLPTSSCSTVENTNQQIPVPGQFIVQGDPSDKVGQATGAGCAAAAAAQTAGVQGLQTGTASNGAGEASGSAPAASTTPAPNNPGAVAPSGMITLASTSAMAVSPVAPSVVASSPAYSPAPVETSTGTASLDSTTGGSSNSTASGGASCSTDGAVVCNGPDQFGLCNFGQVVWQPVAAGTTCVNGVISKRSAMEHNPHLRRHHIIES